MSVAQIYSPAPISSSDRERQRRERLAQLYEKKCRAAIKDGRVLLSRQTLGDDAKVLGRMQRVAKVYNQSYAALGALVRTELL